MKKLISSFEGCFNQIVIIDSHGESWIDYNCLGEEIQTRVAVLEGMRLPQRSCVILEMESTIDCLSWFFALIYYGAIPVSIKPSNNLYGDYNEYVERIAKEVAGVLLHDLLSNGAKGCTSSASEDTVFIQFSSGSTSEPKPIFISDSALHHNLNEILNVDSRTKDDWVLNVLPLCHDMGLIGGLLSNLILRNNFVLVETSIFLRRPFKVLAISESLGVSITAMPTFMMRFLSRIFSKRSVKTNLIRAWKTIYVGAEPIREAVVSEFCRVFRELDERSLVFSYGMAESVLIIAYHRVASLASSFSSRNSNIRFANCGSAISGMEFRVVNEKESGYGNIEIRGGSLTVGRPGEWYDTGDLGWEVNGELFVVGRDERAMVIDGVNIYAVDIERSLIDGFCLDECLVECNEELRVLAIRKGTEELETDLIRDMLKRGFGISQAFVKVVPDNQVVRTTSGKPIKKKTFFEICDKN